MAFSRKALKARAKVRKDAAANNEYVVILRQGEQAAVAAVNPYAVGSEEFEIWQEGYAETH